MLFVALSCHSVELLIASPSIRTFPVGYRLCSSRSATRPSAGASDGLVTNVCRNLRDPSNVPVQSVEPFTGRMDLQPELRFIGANQIS